jgi:hypothetical protein
MSTAANTQPTPTPYDMVDVAEAGEHDQHFFSVTSILKALSSPALEYWAIKQTAMAAIDSQATWNAMLDDQGRIETIKWLCGARWRRPKLELGADQLGTVVHRVCEHYALSGEKPSREWVEDLVRAHAAPTVRIDSEVNTVGQMLNQFDSWLARFQPEYTAAEMPVFNEQFGYAGSLDAILTIGGTKLLTDYKGLDIATPLATPDGWTTMGAVNVGDKVFGTDGKRVTVTGKSGVHLNRCYRVTFDDTTSIVCDDEHLWTVFSTYKSDRRDRRRYETLRTDELAAEIRHHVNGRRHWAIAMPEALVCAEEASYPPVDPYVYGCWLGDGTARDGVITGIDQEIFDRISNRGYTVGEPMGPQHTSRRIYGLERQLRFAGLLGHRTVPQRWLRRSVPQRLDLLRGLMDTDGYYNPRRKMAVFTTVNKATADMLYELVVGLGERPLVSSFTAKGFGKITTAYHVMWRPLRHNPFALSRKANRVDLSHHRGQSWRRLITSIEPTLTVPTQCITVDADDGCYLAGTQMVPTHNTRREPLDSRGNAQTPYGETALQLAAYRHAEIAAVFRARRVEKYKRRYYLLSPDERAMAPKMPQVDGGLCIILTPQSCEAYPVKCDQEVFDFFLYTFEAWRWLEDVSKRVVGDALIEPHE